MTDCEAGRGGKVSDLQLGPPSIERPLVCVFAGRLQPSEPLSEVLATDCSSSKTCWPTSCTLARFLSLEPAVISSSMFSGSLFLFPAFTLTFLELFVTSLAVVAFWAARLSFHLHTHRRRPN